MLKRLRRLKRLQDFEMSNHPDRDTGRRALDWERHLAGGGKYSSICRVILDVVTEDVRDASLFLVNGVR